MVPARKDAHAPGVPSRPAATPFARGSTLPRLPPRVVVPAAAGVALLALLGHAAGTLDVATPVHYLAGDDAGPASLSAYVTTYEIASNATSLAATVRGVPGSSLVIDSFFKIHNADAAGHAVTLRAAQIHVPHVRGYTLEIHDASGALQGTLDFTDAAPTAQFAMHAGATHSAKLTLTVDQGAGEGDVAFANGITLQVG